MCDQSCPTNVGLSGVVKHGELGVDLDSDAVVVAGDDAVDRLDAEHPGANGIADWPLFSRPADQYVVQPAVWPRRVVDIRIGL